MTVHLDFDGTPAFEFDDARDLWASGPAAGNSDPIPAFTIDGNANDYTQAELDAIGAIWQHVKEKFSPFDINVTTVAPPNYNDGVAVHAIMGGSDNDWYMQNVGGVAPLNSFTNGNPQSAFTFTVDAIDAGSVTLNDGDRHFIAETAAHEVGHTMGLNHQSLINNGIVLDQYFDGTSTTAPIMGGSSNNSPKRGLWWIGDSSRTNEDGNPVPNGIQDDLAVLTRPGNFINYRPDDYGSFSGSGSINVNSSTGVASAAGVIETNGDQDAFTFTAIAPIVSFTVNNGDFGGMLAPTLELIPIGAAASGSVTLTTTQRSATLSATGLTPGGGYVLRVTRQGGEYGSLGQYTITGTTGAFAALSGGILTINGFDTVNDLLISYHSGTDNIVLQDDVFGGSAVQQFPRSQVNEIRVRFDSYDKDDEINILGQFSGLSIPIDVSAGHVGTDTLILQGTTGNDVMSMSFFNHTNNNTPIFTASIEQFILTGFDGADTYNLNRTILNTLVTVNAGTGNDVINVGTTSINPAEVRASITVNGEAGNDTLNVGGGWLDSVTGLVTYNGGAFDDDRLVLNDTSNFLAYAYQVTETSITREPSFPGVNFSNAEEVTLNCSNGHNQVTLAPLLTYPVVVNGNDGGDNFIVGGGSLDFEGAGMTLNGGNGTDQITYDNHNDVAGRTYNVHPNEIIVQVGVEEFVMTNAGFEAIGLLTGSGADTIIFHGNITKGVTIDAGPGNDRFDTNKSPARNINTIGGPGSDILEVDDVGIPTGTIFQHAVYGNQVWRYDFVAQYDVFYSAIEQLDLLLPAQQNSVYVGGTSAGFTQIFGTNLSDNVTVNPRDGAGNATIGGQVNIFCGDGADAFEVDSTASSTPSEYILGLDFFGFNPQITVVGGGSVMVQNSEAIRLRAGGGDDVFRVNAFPGIAVAVPTLDLFGGNGNDTLHLGNGNLPVNVNPVSTFNFDGQGGTDTFYLDNTAATGQWTYENTATDILANRTSGGAYFERFNYVRVEQLNVWAGAGNDTFNLFALNAGQGLSFAAGAGTNGMNLIDTAAVRGPVYYDDSNAGGINNINKLTVSASPITLHVAQNSIGAHPGDNFFGPGGSLSFNTVTNISLTMGSANDVVYAKPSPTTAITLRGGNPTTAPGDTIHLALANAANYQIGPGPFGVGFRVTSTNNQPLDYSDFETVNTDAVAPQILSRSFNPTVGSQSVSFTFSEDVSASLNVNSLQVTAIDPATMAYSYVGNTATWTFPGLGGVLPSRLYTAGLAGATDAAGNAATGANGLNFMWVTGTAGEDTFRLVRRVSNGFLDIFINGGATPAFSVKLSSMNQFNLHAGDGADVVTVDHTGGGPPPIPAGTLPFFDGGGGAGDVIGVIGTAAANTATFAAGSVTVDGFAFPHAGIEAGEYRGGGGADTLTVSSGTVRLPTSETFAALTIASGAAAHLAPGGDKVIVASDLDVAPTGRLDLADNDLILDYNGDSPAAAIEALVASGYHGGDWFGNGITSSVAQADNNFAVGVADNALLNTAYTSFSGVSVDTTTVLLKFTWVCDIDLDGLVTTNDAITFGNNYSLGDPATRMVGDIDFDGLFTTNDAIVFGNNYDTSLPQL